MSKKTPVKKSKRRLKKSVRRSLAAVLMITAIGVAAVPVPEAAADETGNKAGARAVNDVHNIDAFKYEVTQTASDNTVDSRDEKIPGSNATTFNLGKYVADINNVPALLQKSDIKQSLATTNVGSEYSLSWQFLYYPVTEPHGQTAGVVCKYNDTFSAEKIALDLRPNTQYYTVETSVYDAYYNNGIITSGIAMNQTNIKKDPGDSVTTAIVSETGHHMDLDPTKTIEYTYDNYINNTLNTQHREILETYFQTKLNEYEGRDGVFPKYQADKAAWEKENPDGDYSTVVEKPSMKVVPSTELSGNEKLKFFCEHDTNLNKYGSGYTLVLCGDSRAKADSTGSGVSASGGRIYLARNGKAAEGGQYLNDNNEFLVIDQSPYYMCAIGNRALKGVTNVVNMQIPGMIGYIGDEAFEDAGLLQSITLDNVKAIGNRAFKNCRSLHTVTMAAGTETIGAECFYSTAVTSITFPSSVSTIGYGAFADCTSLATVNMDGITVDCVIKNYAFYDCSSLTSVAMSNSKIKAIGDGVFAVSAGSQPMDIVLPQEITSTYNSYKGLGDFMFAERSNLGSVVFPQKYGAIATSKVTIPDAMFHGCAGLKYVEFPTEKPLNSPSACGYVSYDPAKLFADVTNEDFYVRGPKNSQGGDYATPRQKTWEAVTAVSQVVPYVYKENGVDYYEVSDGTYLLCIDSSSGILTSCTFSPTAKEKDKVNVNLVIPAKVGNTMVKGIATNCFKDKDLNKEVISLRIEDDGEIATINNGVFRGNKTTGEWQKLRSVYIGNSVTTVGDNAFRDDENLIDVTFSSPSAGHAAFKLGQDAFLTSGTELTFHGDIVEGYAPFVEAMKPDKVIREQEGIRICYKSLAPSYLTVMYNPITEMVTLLDYPKYSQISSILNDIHKDEIARGRYGSYENMMTQRSYAQYSDSFYDGHRTNFANAWESAGGASISEENEKELYQSEFYGPWITPAFCNSWEKWVGGAPEVDPTPGGGDDPSVSGNSIAGAVADFLFEPITVYAADNGKPDPYYTTVPYDPTHETGNIRYTPISTEESALLNATLNVVIPAGVESIDVYGYYEDLNADGTKNTNASLTNAENVSTYFELKNWDAESRRMYTRKYNEDPDDNTEIEPGLFSGYYDDKVTGKQIYTRGNDRILSVTLNSVKYLPDYAFDSCERLRSVTLGNACSDIGTAPFRGCYDLTTVGNNQWYTTENGIVYSVNSDGSYTIEECLSARGKVPDPGNEVFGVGENTVALSTDPNMAKVSVIKPGAFEDCDDISSVDLREAAGLTTIPEDCFRNCDELQRIWLPRTVNNIESGAFVNALKLSELQIPGTEVYISAKAFEPNDKKAYTTIFTSEDSSARRYAGDHDTEYKLQYQKIGDQWRVIFLDADGQQIGEAQYVDDGFLATPPDTATLPEKENWTYTGEWLGTSNTTVSDKIYQDTIFIAQGYYSSGMVDGKYKVDFVDQIDGKIFNSQLVAPGGDAIMPQAPVHAGYTFLQWGGDATTNVQKNSVVLAMYSGGNGPGGTNTTTSGSTTNTSNNSAKSSSTSSSTTNSSTSATSTSGTASGLYTLIVINGSGSGSYAPGTSVIITANSPAAGQTFSKWTTESQGVTLASVSQTPTTFVMPSNNVTITAEFTAGAANTNTNTGTNTGRTNNDTNNNNGSTRVDITKPGISNKDLATANVNGSTDNFVVKISETPEATQAVINALTNKYGQLDNILYYAMDISLYDSTGTTKISDITGLTVDITMPLPDALTAFGGNNMMGAVVSDQLEDMNARFTSINGISCISFTATHFSPYTIYVDTQNLSDGLMDISPKTGDPIHPKWFLSLGLACLSIILFMKRDKKPDKKAAAETA